MARSCPHDLCDGSGLIYGDDDVVRPCECRAEVVARIRSKALSGVIPKRFRGASFDRPPVTEIDPRVVRAVRRYTEDIDARLDEGRGLWLMGDVGTGKTTLAMIVCKAALERRRSVAIYSLPRLLATIRSTYEKDTSETYEGLIEKLTSVELLHIDDLGFKVERYVEQRGKDGADASFQRTSIPAELTPWVIEQLYSVINTRWEDQRAVTITTNLDPGELRQQLGERTVSRLVEICGDPLPLFGADRRVQLHTA